MSEVKWIPLAEVARPHGVRGELRLKVYNSDSELLFSQPEVLVRRPGSLVGGASDDRMMQFESLRGAGTGFLLAKFRGVEGRDAADLFRGASVCVDRDRFPPLDEGEFYVCDVIGARLVAPRGEIGIIDDFVSYPTADVLVVRPAPSSGRGGVAVELPLLDDFIERVDTTAGHVVLTDAGLEWLEGVRAGTKNHAD